MTDGRSEQERVAEWWAGLDAVARDRVRACGDGPVDEATGTSLVRAGITLVGRRRPGERAFDLLLPPAVLDHVEHEDG